MFSYDEVCIMNECTYVHLPPIPVASPPPAAGSPTPRVGKLL